MEKKAGRLWLTYTFGKLVILFHIYGAANKIYSMSSPEDSEMKNMVYAFKNS